MDPGEVAFVIVCWNRRQEVAGALASIQRPTVGAARIFVVDNGSEDGSPEFVRSEYPVATLIEAGRDLGFPAAANIGIRAALADPACRYVALLNDDAWIADDWLAILLAFAELHPRGASFQGLTVDGRDPDVVDSFGLCIGHAGRALQLGYRSRGLRPATGEVFGVNGAAALYSRAFLDAQPFGDEYLDSDLHMYLEDADLAARAAVMGWHSYFVGDAVAYHLGSGGGRENRPLSVRMNSRNEVLVLVKNFPWSIVIRTVPGMARAELARYRSFARTRDFRNIATALGGKLQSLPALPGFLRKRSTLNPHRVVRARVLWQLMDADVPRSERRIDAGPGE
jgi:GT2 family glycosyltransferase